VGEEPPPLSMIMGSGKPDGEKEDNSEKEIGFI
jgi:hypothetical protein